jgi:hypothetical protein
MEEKMQTKTIKAEDKMAYILRMKFDYYKTTDTFEVRRYLEPRLDSEPPSQFGLSQALQWWQVAKKTEWGKQAEKDYNRLSLVQK